MAKNVVPIPVPVVEEAAEECPKCPPPGAPAWLATFADMATLLMCFFVLILSFAEFNQPKFKMIAGSMRNAFGIQREVPVMEMPKGTTVLELKFSPSPDPSAINEIKQDTTDTEKPQPKVKDGEGENEGKGTAAQQELAQALSEALQSGAVTARVEDGQVVMEFKDTGANQDQQKMAEQLQDAAQAVAEAQAQTGQSPDDVQIAGLTQNLQQLADMAEQATNQNQTQQLGSQGNTEGAGTPGEGGGGGAAERKAELSEAQLRVALREEIAQGLVSIEQREGKVFVTVGAGGAFPSGTADLTNEARDIMSRIAFGSMSDAGEIKVTGHTDNVPISGGQYRDNWDLAAARSASVVREIADSGLIDPTRLTAISMGESKPVADNTTDEGREKNRRIEIEITY